MDHNFDIFINLFLEDNPQYKDILSGGKRIRPTIVLDVASFIDPSWHVNQEISYRIKNFAMILELIHSTSLIIDDLPSMDNDMYRRNELTFHTKYGQHSTYLMVYNLLSLTKKLLWNSDDKTLNYINLEELINQELINLVDGQKYDLDPSWHPTNENESRTLKIAELKTASLFKLAFLGPYYLLKSSEDNELKEKLTKMGLNLGMAFQLSDDYLDYDIDDSSNNYGRETSKENLENKYIEYVASVLLDMRDLKWNDASFIYKIIKMMNKRFTDDK
jgi:geranylgeranyl diphosphate synthase type II